MPLASFVQACEVKKIGFLPNFDYFRGAQNSIFNSVDGFVIRSFGVDPHRAETGCPPADSPLSSGGLILYCDVIVVCGPIGLARA